jgi:hypothetical protein
MIISYPFLPARGADASDDDYEKSILDLEMLNAGIYPSSREREWHGGIHILAPTSIEPVRAIADGTLVAYRLNSELTKERPEDTTGRIDNSFVLIRHETESDSIAGNNGAESSVKVAFYSLYMHLMNTGEMKTRGINRQQVHAAVADSGQAVKPGNNAKVYRKDIIGFPGESYSTGGMIHFEIFTNSDDLSAFFVNSQNAGEVGKKGTWGDSYFIVKAGSAAVASHPAGNTIGGHTFPAGQSGKVNATKDLFVRIAFKNGTKYTTTWMDGEQDKAPTQLTSDEGVADADYEYAMYEIATALYPSCPSAGYELLRFGKVLGTDKDKLAANENHNWQVVTFANGEQGYIDLADSSVVTQVLSDADFPFWLGWQKGIGGLFADSGQCDMHDLLDVLKVSHDGENSDASRQQLRDYFGDPEHRHVRDWSQRLVVQYPSEWDKANNTRCTKLKEKDGLAPGRDGPFFGNDDEYDKHMQFVESLQWWGDAGLGDSNVWHFHPFAFIKHFRKCGWLSDDELSYMMPAHIALTQSGPLRTPTGASLSAEQSRKRLSPRKNALNRALRKYSLNATSQRLGLFFAQTIIETDRWKTFREYGQGAANPNIPMAQYYAAFYGRGAMQLTWADAYEKYGQFRRFNDAIDAYADPRITQTSMHYWSDPTARDAHGHIIGVKGVPKRWAPRFDPDIVASDVANACDSAGFFWVWKHHSGARNINRVADKQFSASVVDRINKLVNGGGFGYFERFAYSYYTRHILSDWISSANMLTVDTAKPHVQVQVDLSRPT